MSLFTDSFTVDGHPGIDRQVRTTASNEAEPHFRSNLSHNSGKRPFWRNRDLV
jgi:hypothetical protein